jgi:ABC-type branched-subunit amino acid transport system substrate-binding protein
MWGVGGDMRVAADATGVRVKRFGAWSWCWILLVLAAGGWALVRPGPVQALEEAQAAQGPPLDIALFVSSRGDVCHDPGDVAAVRKLAMEEQARINRRGGVAGRPINVRIFDDERNEAKLIANMRAALSDRNLLGIVGLSNSTRAKALFSALGKEIGASGAPFLSAISVSTLFADYPNVFTSQASQDEERVPVMAAFTRALGFAKPAFVGSAGSVMSDAMRDGLLTLLGDKALVADRRIRVVEGKADTADIAAAVAELAKQAPDLIYLSVGSRGAPDVIAALKAAGLAPALFITGRIDALPPDVVKAYPGPLYQLAWEDLPEVFNNKVRALVERNAANTWVFEGRKIPQAPGWKKGECKERSEAAIRDPFETANMRAISAGARYADMMSLIARTVRRMPPESGIDALRSRVVSSLTSEYAVGRGAFKGTFENWSFDPATRTAARTPFVVMQPQALERLQLAPVQFRRARNGQLRQISTLYADIDLIKAHRIDDSTKTFTAEFYLALRDAPGVGIDRIDFANAFLDPSAQGRQLSIETLHDGGSNGMFPSTMKIYKVVGRFLFEPRLSKYPFDTQSFSIDLQPKTGNATFMIQPPPTELRDRRVVTDGWEPIEQYVGYQEEFVPVVDSFTHQAGIAPFYSSSFVWQMRRETTDYFLRVVVPLAFILAVAYLAIFIPMSRFDSIVAIQVTALLSAVALYISLPKIDSDDATLSDRIFLFDYLMVSVMITITILRINPLIEGRPWLRRTLEAVHVVAIPAIVVVGAFYVYGLSVAGR